MVDAVRVSCAPPVPESGETVSQLVVRFDGETDAVHAGDPPLKVRPTCEDEAVLKFTDAGETAAVIEPDAVAASVVDVETLSVFPDSVVAPVNVKL